MISGGSIVGVDAGFGRDRAQHRVGQRADGGDRDLLAFQDFRAVGERRVSIEMRRVRDVLADHHPFHRLLDAGADRLQVLAVGIGARQRVGRADGELYRAVDDGIVRTDARNDDGFDLEALLSPKVQILGEVKSRERDIDRGQRQSDLGRVRPRRCHHHDCPRKRQDRRTQHFTRYHG